MIELFKQNMRETSLHSSKGNQLKWENGGIWYKADYTGYEGLAEYMISHLLKFSTLTSEEYIIYDLEEMQYHSVIYRGAKSQNFLTDDWQVITLERLFKNAYGISLYKSIYQLYPAEERMKFLVDQVEQKTKIKNFGVYMNKLMTVDALFLNEDRHLHNVAVLVNANGDFKICPIFDNGAGLLADTMMDYPLDEDVYDAIDRVKAKTVSEDFAEQMDITEQLYGRHISFSFTQKDVEKLLSEASGYSDEIKNRVQTVIFQQMRKYSYLFKRSLFGNS